MDEKIHLERERNKLFELSQKLLALLKENGVEVNLPEFKKIRAQSGVPLFPGECETVNINYKPFRNDF